MMTTPKNKKSKLLSWLSLPLAGVVFFAFVEKVPAKYENQNKADTVLPEISTITKDVGKMNGGKWEDALLSSENRQTKTTENPFEEFQKILDKYSNLLEQKKYAEFERKITSEDKKKLMLLYPQLTDDQQNSLPLAFVNLNKKLPKISPENNQLEDFQNPQKYGVWIDGKKVSNSTLKNYSKGDFSQIFVSKVHKNAQNSKNPQPFQVNLMTNKYYENYLATKGSTVLAFKGSEYSGKQTDTIRPKSKENQKLPPPPPSPQQVDELPIFPGGTNALRRKIFENFNTRVINGDEWTVKSVITFHIDENGKTSNFNADGTDEKFNQESIKAITSATENILWTPAKIKGKPVSYIFKIPLTMKFEKNPGIKSN